MKQSSSVSTFTMLTLRVKIKYKQNQTFLSTESIKLGPQTSLDRICFMHCCRGTTWHMWVDVCLCVWHRGSCTPVLPSAPAPAPARGLSPKQSISLYGYGHCLIPHTVPPVLPLLKPKHTVSYGRNRLFKKCWEKKERPFQRVIWF